MEAYILSIIGAIVGIWLGSVEIRIRNVDNKLRDIPTRDEVFQTVDLKQEALKAMQKRIREDIQTINIKVDKLIEMQNNIDNSRKN